MTTVPNCVFARSLASLLLLVAFVPGFSTVASAAEAGALFVSAPVTPGVFRGDLRDLPKAKDWAPGDPVTAGPPRRLTHPAVAAGPEPVGQVDPLLGLQTRSMRSVARAFTTPDVNRDGIGNTGVQPPDTIGDIGINHYVQAINSSVGTSVLVIDKTTGTTVAGPFTLDSLFVGGGPCNSGGGDPAVLFDQIAQRWVLAEFPSNGNDLCVYVSQTSSPVSGGWYTYDFPMNEFPDYPKFSVWPDAYYATTNESSPAVYAFDRTAMLTGASATFQRKTGSWLSGFGFQAFTPVDIDGLGTVPVSSPAFMVRHRDDEVHNAGSNNASVDYIEVWGFSVDFATSSNSTFTKLADLAVSEFDSTLCGLSTMECIPQPSTAQKLDPLREIVMNRAQYRNLGSHQSIVGSFAVDVGSDHAGVRWFELRRSGAGAWSLYQEGTVAPDSAHRWNSSIAMDGSGNIALGYSVSGTSVSPGIRYTGRLEADSPGTMTTGETTMQAGGGSQTSGERWGDYSAMSVDPVDNCRFWYTNEYIPAGGSWRTRIASFRFDAPDCVDSSGATCGNNVMEVGEECDGSDASSCPGSCNGSCVCPAPVCGNDLLESGEECDGTDDASCPGFCSLTCGCPAPVCGNDVLESGEECDGNSDAACPGACDGSCLCPVACDPTDLYIPTAKSNLTTYMWKIDVDNSDGSYDGFDPRSGVELVVTEGLNQVTTMIPATTGWERSDPAHGKYMWSGNADGVTKVKIIDKSITTGAIRVLLKGRDVPGADTLDVITQYADVELTMGGHCGGGVY